MPGGLEVIKRMPLRHIPIIALTALVIPGDRERCLVAGANKYLAKPVTMITLMQTIAAQLVPRSAGEPS